MLTSFATLFHRTLEPMHVEVGSVKSTDIKYLAKSNNVSGKNVPGYIQPLTAQVFEYQIEFQGYSAILGKCCHNKTLPPAYTISCFGPQLRF